MRIITCICISALAEKKIVPTVDLATNLKSKRALHITVCIKCANVITVIINIC